MWFIVCAIGVLILVAGPTMATDFFATEPLPAPSCSDGYHGDGPGCTKDGQHSVGDGYTCPDGDHREGSKCIRDGQHSVGDGVTCPDGYYAIGDLECRKNTAL
jgi:hypothetical protein